MVKLVIHYKLTNNCFKITNDFALAAPTISSFTAREMSQLPTRLRGL